MSLQMSRNSLARSLAEALDAAYVEGREPPYQVPYHVDGDLFLFATAKSRVDAIDMIREAARLAVSRFEDAVIAHARAKAIAGRPGL
jgi:hypothetical protein